MSETPITDDACDYTAAEKLHAVCKKLESELSAMKAERDGLKAKFEAAFEMQHDWNGLCPDSVVGMDSRDPNCPACRALMEVMS